MEQMSLFDDQVPEPLAARLRPRRLEEYVGLADPVPLVIRNGVTGLMKELDYGKGYQYAHDAKDKLTNIQCLPDSLLGREYYSPTEQGMETQYKERLNKRMEKKAQLV